MFVWKSRCQGGVDDADCEEKVDTEREDRLNPSTGRAVHQKPGDHCANLGVSESISQGPAIGYADADLFHQPARKRAEFRTKGRARKSKRPAFKNYRKEQTCFIDKHGVTQDAEGQRGPSTCGGGDCCGERRAGRRCSYRWLGPFCDMFNNSS